MSNLVDRFMRLSRAVRLALGGLVLIGLYFGVVEPMLTQMADWNSKADKKLAELRKFDQERERRKGDDATAALGASRFGPVDPPGESGAKSEAFNRRVTKVLETHGIKRPTITTRETALPNNAPLAASAGADNRVEKLISEIQFDATPEQLHRVVKDLEDSPEVAGVPRLIIRSPFAGGGAPTDAESARLLKITIAAETWQLKKKGKTR